MAHQEVIHVPAKIRHMPGYKDSNNLIYSQGNTWPAFGSVHMHFKSEKVVYPINIIHMNTIS